MNDTARPPCSLPERIFAVGEEPDGVRVTPYHKAAAIREILDALTADEVEQIRVSPFGKLVEIADKPSFSGRFGRFMISRQLRVTKKHEAWFLFAGKPIRFGIREFALVTGLNCNKFPKRCKKKSKHFMAEKPYWGELFGSLRDVPVSSAVRMLKTRKVVDKDIRLKYAYLCLLSAVILPTTHAPRISQSGAEMIKDLDAFLAYPWGRCSFDMLMSSIKERKEVSLSQNTIALKGFVLALQLVIVECVPALTEVVQDGSSSGSECESGGEDGNGQGEKRVQKSISPGHARDTDAEGKALVQSIMLDPNGETTDDAEFTWSDDENDIGVSNMLNLIQQGFAFNNDCFVGGSTRVDVCRMREEAKAELLNRKTVKTKSGSSSQTQDGVDIDLLASIVKEKLKDDFQLLNNNISAIQESATGFTDTIMAKITEVFRIASDSARQISAFSTDIAKFAGTGPVYQRQSSNSRPSVADKSTQTIRDAATIISEAVNFANCGANDPVGVGINVSKNKTGFSGATGNTSGHTVQATTSSSDSPHLPDRRPGFSASPIQPNQDPGLVFPNPTFSLGLTQEAPVDPPKTGNAGAETDKNGGGEEHGEPTLAEFSLGCRKSKRQKVPTKSLMGAYECDKGFQNRARQSVADAIYKGGNIDYSAKYAALLYKMNTPFVVSTERGDFDSTELYQVVERASQLCNKMVDVLMFHTSLLFRSQSPAQPDQCCVFMGTQFVSQFTKLYTKFTKVSRKDSFKFNGELLDMVRSDPSSTDAVRFYFPFNLDKKHWVGVCVDCSNWALTVLDCNNSLRTEYMMTKEIRPIAVMFPYLLKQLGRELGPREGKAMAIERPRSIPQQKETTSSGVLYALFIQAHAVGGVDACKCVTPDVLDSQVERLVVTLYEKHVGPL